LVLVLLAIGAFANWIPVNLFLMIEVGSEDVVGYLGQSTPWYSWPHVTILLLSVLATLQLLVARKPREHMIGAAGDAESQPVLGRQVVAGLMVFGAGICAGWMALNGLGWFPILLNALVLLTAVLAVSKGLALVAGPVAPTSPSAQAALSARSR
jgi:hypothetical protein